MEESCSRGATGGLVSDEAESAFLPGTRRFVALPPCERASLYPGASQSCLSNMRFKNASTAHGLGQIGSGLGPVWSVGSLERPNLSKTASESAGAFCLDREPSSWLAKRYAFLSRLDKDFVDILDVTILETLFLLRV